MFSFNNPFGACPRCQGFGNTIDYDLDRVVPDRLLSLEDGAIEPWTKPLHRWAYLQMKQHGRGRVRFNVPFADLSADERRFVVDGEGRFLGVHGFFRKLEHKKYKVHVRVFLSRYRGYAECRACGGARLRPDALNIRLGGKTIAEAVRLNIAEARAFFDALDLGGEGAAIAGKVLVEIQQRLKFLVDVGLDYKNLFIVSRSWGCLDIRDFSDQHSKSVRKSLWVT